MRSKYSRVIIFHGDKQKCKNIKFTLLIVKISFTFIFHRANQCIHRDILNYYYFIYALYVLSIKTYMQIINLQLKKYIKYKNVNYYNMHYSKIILWSRSIVFIFLKIINDIAFLLFITRVTRTIRGCTKLFLYLLNSWSALYIIIILLPG